mmetsp:Transcript_12204/g.20227  ORF Transcript_12204/g.20227 Transcript_12204/m.20227 type:complete len:111 (+) Transcript_12204:181-513(+)
MACEIFSPRRIKLFLPIIIMNFCFCFVFLLFLCPSSFVCGIFTLNFIFPVSSPPRIQTCATSSSTSRSDSRVRTSSSDSGIAGVAAVGGGVSGAGAGGAGAGDYRGSLFR